MLQLTPKQARFVKNLTNTTLTKEDSAIKAGYSPRSASEIASQLLRKTQIIEAMNKAGLTDRLISRNLKRNIVRGSKLNVTPDVYMRSIDLATKLKGYQESDKPQQLTQNNIYIQELKTMDDSALNDKLTTLLEDVNALKSK